MFSKMKVLTDGIFNKIIAWQNVDMVSCKNFDYVKYSFNFVINFYNNSFFKHNATN